MPEKDSRKNELTSKNDKNFSAQINKKYDDEINIFELLFNLWEKKWVIIFVTLIFIIGAYLYDLQKTKFYKAEVFIITPIQNENDFEKPNQNYFRLESGFIFEKFKKNLESRKIQKKFVMENNLLKELDPFSNSEKIEIFESFFSMINVKQDKNLSVSIITTDPIFAADTVNKFVKFVNSETVKNQVAISQEKINQRIREIEHLMKTKRKMAKLLREDQIARFKEAKSIAESLGFEKRVEATSIIQSTTELESDFTTPLYYIGTKALEAEISVLNNRESDDPFIVGLRSLQEELALLKSYNFDNLEGFGVIIDYLAYPPKTNLERPRETIIFIGIFSGIISGIIISFLISFFQSLQKNFIERKRMKK